MKISVIIPAHNEEKYLSDTLEAILAQDYPDYEVIVIDNASTDKTSEIAESFKRVKVLHESRKGTMWACECGRKEATGEIIVRMDADCLPEKDWLSKGAAFFKDESIVVVSGPYDYHDASPFFRKMSMMVQKYIYLPLNVMMQKMKIQIGITLGGNTFIRSSDLQSIGGFNTDITFYGDDTDLPKRMSHKGKVVFHKSITNKTSARRFKNDGILRVQARYLFHFFKVIFSK
ncbi:MAG: glycosyltransferase family A protein [Candidatus Pacebacteria bacterium]|nr:glycosyltransferase family A protein [Candidatus Paceibacterota bacterium]